MKTRNKMMLIILPIMTACIILLNITYGLFFQGFILSEEARQVGSINTNLTAYISDNKKEYTGRINDWSHWDDTYAFLNGSYQEYKELNIIKETFYNIDINFILFTDRNDVVVEKDYYDFQRDDFAEFPEAVTADLEALIKYAGSAEDVFGIMELGSRFYFIAASEVTDSAKTSIPNGRMIIGREIDDGMIQAMEKNLGGSIESIESASHSAGAVREPVSLENSSYDNRADSIKLAFLVASQTEEAPVIRIALTKTRDMYLQGIKNVIWFAAGNTILFLLVALLIFILLNKYISKPFIRMFNDIVAVDLNRPEFVKLPEEGSHDFLALRQTVNKMLERIDLEQKNVRNQEEKLQATLLSVGDGVITAGVDKRVQFINPAAEKLLGWSNEDASGEDIYTVFNIKDDSLIEELERSALIAFERDEALHLSYQTLMTTRDDVEKYVDITIAPIKDKHDSLLGYVFVFRDFSEKREKQEKIRYLSYHDQLTDVYNRRFFEEELVRLDKPENLPISFIYADVNGLKFINDAFGHQSGDQMILAVANVLKETCGEGLIARLGGDEFVVVLTRTDTEHAAELADQVRDKVEQIKINNIDISMSLGWDTKYKEQESAIITIKNAEDSMYQKKLLSVNSKSNAIIKTILNTLMLKNPREKHHSQRVAMLCKATGEALGLHADRIQELETAGDLHDIGKIILDETIVNKSGRLTEAEWIEVKKHPETGYRLLGNSTEFYKIAEFVRDHHERWDGGGYPQGLKGEEIHWEARIITIADAYDAMTAERPYRRTLTESEAAEEIIKNAGRQFDPALARVFVEKVLGYPWIE